MVRGGAKGLLTKVVVFLVGVALLFTVVEDPVGSGQTFSALMTWLKDGVASVAEFARTASN